MSRNHDDMLRQRLPYRRHSKWGWPAWRHALAAVGSAVLLFVISFVFLATAIVGPQLIGP